MIYISSPPEGLYPEIAKANVTSITQKIFDLGALVINPLNLGIPNTWLQIEKDNKRKQVILEKATAIFLQADWNQSTTAKKEFLAVNKHNSNRKNRFIQIYFEDFHGFNELESDLRERILIPEIPAV